MPSRHSIAAIKYTKSGLYPIAQKGGTVRRLRARAIAPTAVRVCACVCRYTHAARWADNLLKRPEVQRGLLVCRKYGKPWLVDDRFKHLAKL